MEMRFLGGSGLLVSPIAFGAMTFGGTGPQAVGETQVEEATRMVARCLERGVNLFDTADVYANGASEEVLGRALRGHRHEVLLATKVSGPTGPGVNDQAQSRHHILRACEASLRRLGTDYIDLYQLHNIDEITPPEETLRALDDLVRQGKVRYIGCSNYSAWHLMRALAVSERRGLERFVSLQADYNLLCRDLEHELIPLCLDQRVGVIVWGPLANGFLAGRQRRGQEPPKESRRSGNRPFDKEQAFDVIDVMEVIARAHGGTVAQVALSWLLRKPAVSSVLIGARTLEQLNENLDASKLELTSEDIARLDAVSGRPLPYPQWHQRQSPGARLRQFPHD